MATPQIDFYNAVVELLPPEKRLKKFMAWIRGLTSQMVRLYDIFYRYLWGSFSLAYSSSTSYAVDAEIIYKYKVYKSLVSSNLANTPDVSPNQWLLILNSFIGVYERSKIVPQKLVLEYILNRYFFKELTDNSFVGFVQPNSATSPTNSSIYISNVVPTYPTYLVGIDESSSDSVFDSGSTGYVTTAEVYSAASSYLFQINIPTAVYTSINSSAVIAETIVRQFLDTYVPAGIFYQIQTY
jgi:hypothetical protein